VKHARQRRICIWVELRAKTLLTRHSLGASLKKAEDLQHVSAPK
jgi:hypothetical protein